LVNSISHPQTATWYKDNNPVFSWTLPKGAKAVSLIIDKSPETVPDFVAKNLFSSYQAKNVADGIWYLHIQFATTKGWTKTAHYRFNVDTTPPRFLNVDLKGREFNFTLPKASLFDFSELDRLIIYHSHSTSTSEMDIRNLNISSVDDLSGLAGYEVKIDNQTPILLTPETENLPLNNLAYGPHEVEIEAIDTAGNSTSLVKKFNVSESQSELYLNLIKELKRSRMQATWVTIISLIISVLMLTYLAWRRYTSGYCLFNKQIRDDGVIRVCQKISRRMNRSTRILLNIQKRRPLTTDESKLLLLILKVREFYAEYKSLSGKKIVSQVKKQQLKRMPRKKSKIRG